MDSGPRQPATHLTKKLLDKLTKRKRNKIQINKIRHVKGDIKTETENS